QGFTPAVFAPTFSSYLPSFITDAGGATEGAYIPMPQVPLERLTDTPQSQWTPGTFELQRYMNALNRYRPGHHPPGSFGAPGGPDFWDKSTLVDWQKYMCAHQNDKNPDGSPLFPNMSAKKALLTEC